MHVPIPAEPLPQFIKLTWSMKEFPLPVTTAAMGSVSMTTFVAMLVDGALTPAPKREMSSRFNPSASVKKHALPDPKVHVVGSKSPVGTMKVALIPAPRIVTPNRPPSEPSEQVGLVPLELT